MDGGPLKPATAGRVFARMALVSSGFLFLDLLFWSFADFGRFQPPSLGTWQERIQLAALTALGPIGMTRIEALRTTGLVVCGAVVTSVAAALHWRQVIWVQTLAFIAIFVWWFFGLGVAAIRID